MKKIQIKGKDYVQVNERVMFFRENVAFEGWQIITEIIAVDAESILMKASILNPPGFVVATGHAQEYASSSFINKTSYIENCETSAVGRALGFLGIGIDTSLASFEEVANAIKQQDDMKKELTPGSDVWAKAVEHLKKPGSTIDNIKKRYALSEENEAKLLEASI